MLSMGYKKFHLIRSNVGHNKHTLLHTEGGEMERSQTYFVYYFIIIYPSLLSIMTFLLRLL